VERKNGFDDLATFFPGYFALVMATGIVSIAVHFQGRALLALGLFWFNAAAYAVLWGITLLRLAWFPRPFLNDLTHHSRGAAFLTKAAGTCVLGAQFALLTRWRHVAEGLWFFGAGLSVVLSYTFFTAITLCEPKPSLAAGINGEWLLVVVATESISVLGALVAPAMGATEVVLFISLCAYSIGAMVYAFFATLILYRWMFFSMRPERLTPDYWIDMGALAITTVAGALLVNQSSLWSLLHTLAPFLTGLTLFFWATATRAGLLGDGVPVGDVCGGHGLADEDHWPDVSAGPGGVLYVCGAGGLGRRVRRNEPQRRPVPQVNCSRRRLSCCPMRFSSLR
jgi:tellurite resistance protein TehA-like permease